MTDREVLELLLQKMVNMEANMNSMEANMATKDDIAKLETKIESGFADVIAMSDVTQKEVQAIRRDLRTIEAVTAKNWNDILSLREAK